jgi:hypothetical protein
MTIGLLTLTPRSEAHKPITSPFTFNEDIFPLVRDRCGRCHVSGGVAPMSLMTHADAVPWGESIRAELLAGTMPPWSVDTSPGKFRNVEGLTAREMNMLLTWVTGGTPIGGDKNPAPIALDTAWRLGPPDLELQLPSPVTLNADTRETTTELTLPTGTRERRLVRAVDLRPGTPSIVRAATISVKSAARVATCPPEPWRRRTVSSACSHSGCLVTIRFRSIRVLATSCLRAPSSSCECSIARPGSTSGKS